LEKRIVYERTVGACEYAITALKERSTQVDRMLVSSDERRRQFESRAQALRSKLRSGATTLDDYFSIFSEIEKTQSEAYESLHSEFKAQQADVERQHDSLAKQLGEAEAGVSSVTEEMEIMRARIDEANDRYIEARIQMALLKDRRGRLQRRIDDLKGDIDRCRTDLKAAEADALIRGPRVDTGRSSDEILGDIRKTSGILLGLANVSDEAEAMYESYSRTFNELQERAEQVRQSRLKVMEEIEERMRKWLEVTRNLLDQVNGRYKDLLTRLQATGEVRLDSHSDIEESGLELYVGFKGATPALLDPYLHSGGERSTAVMAFLLSLQQNVLSPFRAVDEFDLHMDPKNREIVSDFIVSTLEGSTDQYLVITPSQVTFRGRDVHIIMINKTEGLSAVSLVQ
jgi:chromosome segregation ATPase